jgi:hypothetical protein
MLVCKPTTMLDWMQTSGKEKGPEIMVGPEKLLWWNINFVETSESANIRESELEKTDSCTRIAGIDSGDEEEMVMQGEEEETI